MASNGSGGRVFDYAPAVANWIPPDTSPNSAKGPGDMGASWKSYAHESPVTPAFAPYATHHPSSAATWSAAGDATSRPEDVAAASWSGYAAPSGRSLSYGGEAAGQPPPSSYAPGSQPPTVPSSRAYDNRRSSAASDMYPPPITTAAIATLESSVPGATAMDPHGYAAWQQPYPFSKSGDTYESWYGGAPAGDHQPQSGYYASR